jgi:ABC-type phosphonate transport system ATPase subunit
MHGAGATLGDTAAVFGSRHTKDIAQHPKQWGVVVDIDVV